MSTIQTICEEVYKEFKGDPKKFVTESFKRCDLDKLFTMTESDGEFKFKMIEDQPDYEPETSKGGDE